MSHNKIEIKDKILKIKINAKINNINNQELLDIYYTIDAFKILEKNKGNEYDKALIKLKYYKQIMVTEYINIFRIIRNPDIYDFIKYFVTFEEKINDQSNDTKPELNEYLTSIDYATQEIIVTMVFPIEVTVEEIIKYKIKRWEIAKLNNADYEVFEMIKMDKYK